MRLDASFIHLLCIELNARLAGARVDKIHNPGKEEFVLHLHTRTEKLLLLICLSPGRARANLVTRAPENPPQPGMFCMLLRKYLQGASLAGVRQPEGERILCFDFAGATEIGEPARFTLCAELTGRRTNLLLLREDGVIVDCLKRTDVTQGGRLLLPGARYEPPPRNDYAPPPAVDPLPAEGCSALLEAWYDEKDRAERKRQQAGALLKLVQTRILRAERKLAAQRQELARAQDREHLRVYAELILANKARLEREARGSDTYRLENYYDDGAILSVPVNPARGPAANAQKYFKEYQKAKTAAGLLGELIAKGETELQYLESVSDCLQRASAPAELEALREELELQGYCRPKNGKPKKQRPLPPMEYASSEGLRILVGRNNLQNDQLSLKLAKPGDLWFHTQDIPGSHVLLCADGKTPGEQSIREAAMLAAWHSRARGPAEVDFTPARGLKKPAGAPPGKVIYHTHQSIYAQPTEEWANSLKEGSNGRP
ncbi:MAG: NFACT family protein [Oscillospiraceae bacterium]|nr:NFACT family protein [Oscillospiraceae bacterium]